MNYQSAIRSIISAYAIGIRPPKQAIALRDIDIWTVRYLESQIIRKNVITTYAILFSKVIVFYFSTDVNISESEQQRKFVCQSANKSP